MKLAITLEKDEDGYVVASCPALSGCHSQGTTREDAIDNIREAIRGFVASMRKHGEPIPEVTEVEEVAPEHGHIHTTPYSTYKVL